MDAPPFSPLRRRRPTPGTQVGCLVFLGVLLFLLGLGFLVVYLINPAGKGSMIVVPIVGLVFAGVGGVLLYAGAKGWRGLRIPWTEVGR